MSKVISISNHKGGVGKTTSALNIGAGLNKLGKKILLIDLGSAGDNAQALIFATNATNTLPTEKMRITSAGSVGIGITAPLQKFQVELQNKLLKQKRQLHKLPPYLHAFR